MTLDDVLGGLCLVSAFVAWWLVALCLEGV